MLSINGQLRSSPLCIVVVRYVNPLVVVSLASFVNLVVLSGARLVRGFAHTAERGAGSLCVVELKRLN